MKKFYLVILLLAGYECALAQPANDDVTDAIQLTEVFDYCSNEGAFSSVGATESGTNAPTAWPAAGHDVWFFFTALRHYAQVTVTGSAGRTQPNTLANPLVALYTYNPSNGSIAEVPNGSIKSTGNIAEVYNGGLAIGTTYYIRVSAAANGTGTFRLCLNNYTPVPKPGQDCVNSTLLCSKEPVSTTDILGSGNIQETGGTELGSEQSSAWYSFTAANMGTLAFTITPNDSNDDIDWILYKLNPGQTCSNITYGTGIRFAAGQGRTSGCIDNYTHTGISLTATDDHEDAGCSTNDQTARDGFVSSITANPGDIFYLMVNNVTGGNGFKLSFGGTVEFVGPKAPVTVTHNNPCAVEQTFTVTAQPNAEAVALNWTFGSPGDFRIVDSTATGYTVAYNTPGTKIVALEATSSRGCITVDTKTLLVGLKPLTPDITSNNPTCTDDTLQLSATDVPGAVYSWTGPNNYSGSGQTVRIPVTSTSYNGDYTVFLTNNGCMSDAKTITVNSIIQTPSASFATSPPLPAKLSFPVTIIFTNRSTGSDSWLWDFGDGTTSTEQNPQHTYLAKGDYDVTLTATNQAACDASAIRGKFVIRAYNTIFVPNTFTPNGDGINDEFVITITNMTNYHLTIFNRWGKTLYQTASIFNNWNGRYNNEDLPFGTYYYLITATDANNEPVRRSGSVTLIR